MRHLFLFLLLSLLIKNSSAQDYFQQKVDYHIKVSLDDSTKTLTAYQKITYHNQSPDTLYELYFHLYPNAYSSDESGLAKQLLRQRNTKFYYSKSEERGYISNLKFKVDGQEVIHSFENTAHDICMFKLPEALLPGAIIEIETPFKVKLPIASFSRMGYDENYFAITQWYPKPAVYDKEGWHTMPYLSLGEFYSEFGTFDIEITLPADYRVAAGGNLLNEDEIQWLDSLAIATKAKIEDDRFNSYIHPRSGLKTLRYHQEKVHDFAWFASKEYYVFHDSINLEGLEQPIQSYIFSSEKYLNYYAKASKYVDQGINFYSKRIGNYPYQHVTVVDGITSEGSGMEYPTITVIGPSGNDFFLEEVIVHELGHNWFQGVLANNERLHPWMDEGINTYYESRYMKEYYPSTALATAMAGQNIDFAGLADLSYQDFYRLGYLFSAYQGMDQAIDLHSLDYSMINYGTILYLKAVGQLKYLESILGTDKMDHLMQIYFEQWKFKHPGPNDLKRIFAQNSNVDTDWFFDQMISNPKFMDLKISSLKHRGDSLELKIKAKNTTPIPARLHYYTEQGDSIHYDLPFSHSKSQKIKIADSGKGKLILSPSLRGWETKAGNNTIKTNGLFKKCKPLKFKFLYHLNEADAKEVLFSPVLGWNLYDGFLLGMAFYSDPIFSSGFHYSLTPVYGFKSNHLAGYGNIGYRWNQPHPKLHYIDLGMKAARFSFATEPFNMTYNKVAPYLNIRFNKHALSTNRHSLKFRSVHIFKDQLSYESHDSIYVAVKTSDYYYVNELEYQFRNVRTINPYELKLNLQQADSTIKSSLEFNYRLNYNKDKKGLDIRFFAGTFFAKPQNPTIDMRFRLSGNKGWQDYLYDEMYFGRNQRTARTFWSQQSTYDDGGFHLYTPYGQSWSWLIAANLTSSIPGKFPIKLFADFGVVPPPGMENSFNLQYVAGIKLFAIKDIFEINFPILVSSDLQNTGDLYYDNYWQKISFSLHLNRLNKQKLFEKFVY